MSSINYVNNNYSKSGVIYYKGKQYFRNENPNLGTRAITTNGTYSAEDDGYVGYSDVVVNVPPVGTVIPTIKLKSTTTITTEVV